MVAVGVAHVEAHDGTYTFVKIRYNLRDFLMGCIGGMMSIGVTDMKLRMKIVDGHRFRIRKVSGAPNAILTSNGHDIDVKLGKLRFGKRKEMLVELKPDNREPSLLHHGGRTYTPSATLPCSRL